MAETPLTGSSAYASTTDMVTRYDVRTLGDLLSDTNVRLTSAQVLASTVLTALLSSAAGDIEAAVVKSRRMLPEDLQALTGNALALLVDLNCRLAMVKTLARRPLSFEVKANSPEGLALQKLDRLTEGDNIFPTSEAATAGMKVTRAHTSPTSNDLVSVARRYFGGLTPDQDG